MKKISMISAILLLISGCQPELSKEEAKKLDKSILNSVTGCVKAIKAGVNNSPLCESFKESCQQAKEKNHENQYCKEEEKILNK